MEEVEPPPQPGLSLVHLHDSPAALSASTSRDFQPRWWEGGCIVEEEIPPSWQLSKDGEDTAEVGVEEGNDDTDKGNDGAEDTGKIVEEGNDGADDGSHHTFHLATEHLELLFDIRQPQDKQEHGQRTIHRRLDMLFEALSDAPSQAQCPTCKQKFVSAYIVYGCLGSPKA